MPAVHVLAIACQVARIYAFFAVIFVAFGVFPLRALWFAVLGFLADVVLGMLRRYDEVEAPDDEPRL